MTDESQAKRRRGSMTTVCGFKEKVQCCAELIDVLTRREDLCGRNDLRRAATCVRSAALTPTGRLLDSDLLLLVEGLGLAVHASGYAHRAVLPTLCDRRSTGSRDPHGDVLHVAVQFFEWLAHDGPIRWEMRELTTSAIQLSYVAGALLALPLQDQAVIDRAADHLVDATRVAVALADPDPPSAYEVWREESATRREQHLAELERALRVRGASPPVRDADGPS